MDQQEMKGINGKYGVVMGSYWMSYALVFAFASVFLLSRGFGDAQIGVVMAIGNVAAVVLQSPVASFADRTKRISLPGLCALAGLALIGVAILLLVSPGSRAASGLLFLMAVTLVQLLQPLTNALGMYFVNLGYPLNFGVARGIGSLSYAAAAYFCGILTERFGVDVIAVALIVVYLVFAAGMRLLEGKTKHSGAPRTGQDGSMEGTRILEGETKRTGVSKNGQDGGMEGTRLLEGKTKRTGASKGQCSGAAGTDMPEKTADTKGTPQEASSLFTFMRTYKKFMLMLVGVALLFANHNILNTYLFQVMERIGGTSRDMGFSLSVAAVSELPTMLAFSWLIRKFKCKSLVQVSAIFFTVKSVLFAAAGSVAMIHAAQLVQILAFALFTPASVYYVNQNIRKEDHVKGQALSTTANTVGAVIGSLAGGWVLAQFGAKPMLVMGALLSAAGSVIVCLCAEDGIKTEI